MLNAYKELCRGTFSGIILHESDLKQQAKVTNGLYENMQAKLMDIQWQVKSYQLAGTEITFLSV